MSILNTPASKGTYCTSRNGEKRIHYSKPTQEIQHRLQPDAYARQWTEGKRRKKRIGKLDRRIWANNERKSHTSHNPRAKNPSGEERPNRTERTTTLTCCLLCWKGQNQSRQAVARSFAHSLTLCQPYQSKVKVWSTLLVKGRTSTSQAAVES